MDGAVTVNIPSRMVNTAAETFQPWGPKSEGNAELRVIPIFSMSSNFGVAISTALCAAADGVSKTVCANRRGPVTSLLTPDLDCNQSAK